VTQIKRAFLLPAISKATRIAQRAWGWRSICVVTWSSPA